MCFHLCAFALIDLLILIMLTLVVAVLFSFTARSDDDTATDDVELNVNPASFPIKEKCPRIRRNWLTMTQEQRNLYIEGLLALRSDDGVIANDPFATIAQAHETAAYVGVLHESSLYDFFVSVCVCVCVTAFPWLLMYYYHLHCNIFYFVSFN